MQISLQFDEFFLQKSRKKSWKFVYILAKQCRLHFNLTIFFKKSKESWNFVYILSKHCKSHLNLTKVNLKKNAEIIVKFCLHSHFNLTIFFLKKSKSWKKSWKFVYNLTKRCKSDFNLTIFFEKKVEKNRESLFTFCPNGANRTSIWRFFFEEK